MKFIIAALALSVALAACQDGAAGGGSHALKSNDDSVSYAIGMNMGQGIKRDSLKIDPDVMVQGIKDAMASKAVMKDSVAQAVLMSFQMKMMQKQQERQQKQQDSMSKAGEENKKKATAFLEQNKTKPGVVTLPSGLQYQVITDGTGPTPKGSDNVKVNYKGTLLDGTVFDSSDKNGPATFNASGVIPGWSEALKLMKVGSKWRLWIPPDLGYGMAPPPGGKIPSGALLTFEVELLDIVKEKPGAAPAPAPPTAPGAHR
ncbi:MAG TPA: FKBP-type peptidyl-prolyl cis-trans isomerase [Candidatus Kapabacteria bacterium]|nr:FKBP-type peptidyl-prolyl cis-trans isomerase [Candidatus Kapabacteria bacterium]